MFKPSEGRVFLEPEIQGGECPVIRLCPGGSKRVEGKSRVKTINPGADVFCCFVVEISAGFFCCFLFGFIIINV